MPLSMAAFFNVRLAHMAQVGYQKTVAFTQPTWNVPPSSAPVEPAMRGRSADHRAARLQLHRTNRRYPAVSWRSDSELSQAQRRKREYNRQYTEAKKAERQLRFVVLDES